jgi:hypothetical protein
MAERDMSGRRCCRRGPEPLSETNVRTLLEEVVVVQVGHRRSIYE